MKGRLRKFEGNWIVDYFVESENPNAIYTLKTLPLHPNDVDRMIDEDQEREIDFDISVCVPPNLKSTNGETVSFDAVKYARLTFVPGLSDKTLDELFSLHEPDDFINEKEFTNWGVNKKLLKVLEKQVNKIIKEESREDAISILNECTDETIREFLHFAFLQEYNLACTCLDFAFNKNTLQPIKNKSFGYEY